jgi:hypothetical protein
MILISTVKDRIGFGWDNMYIEIGIIGLQTVVICGLMILLHRGISRSLFTGLIDLDNKIANAIQQLIEGNIELPEPPNPVQQMLVELFMSNMKKNEPNVELLRNEDGKFK